MSFLEDGPQVGSSQPCTPTCEQSVNQLPREHTTFSRLLGATSGTRTLAGAAQGPSQPCHLHAANTLLTGMLLFEGAATSPRAASILVEVTAVHDCVLSQSSNSAQRSTRHPGLRAGTDRKPIGRHGLRHSQSETLGEVCSAHLSPLSPSPLPLALHSSELMACPPHAMTPASCPGRSPPRCPQFVALSTWGTPACSPSNPPLSYLPTAGLPCRAPWPPTSHLTGPWQHPSSELMDS